MSFYKYSLMALLAMPLFQCQQESLTDEAFAEKNEAVALNSASSLQPESINPYVKLDKAATLKIDDTALKNSKSATISFWARIDQDNTEACLFYKGWYHSPYYRFGLTTKRDGSIHLLTSQGHDTYYATGGGMIAPNQWYHFTVVVNGNHIDGQDKYALYLNGQRLWMGKKGGHNTPHAIIPEAGTTFGIESSISLDGVYIKERAIKHDLIGLTWGAEFSSRDIYYDRHLVTALDFDTTEGDKVKGKSTSYNDGMLLGNYSIRHEKGAPFVTLPKNDAFKSVLYVNGYNSVDLVKPEHFKYTTDIIYLRDLYPEGDGHFVLPEYTKNYLNKLNELKGNNKTRIWLCIAGANSHEIFRNRLNTDEKRTRFANDCLEICRKYDLAGIDCDWEFPKKGNDEAIWLSTVHKLQEILEPHGYKQGAAIAPKGNRVFGNFVDLTLRLQPSLECINFMTYDLVLQNDHASYDITNDWMKYYSDRGVKKEKLMYGWPAYARVNLLPASKRTEKYSVIQSLWQPDEMKDVHEGWQYNGVQTVRAKTQWAINNGYGGMMCWALDADLDIKDKRSLIRQLARQAYGLE
ncbi:hypothetical protein FUAX_18910 [Fulvitalea axinellae]|uniref:chitinase n=1 Tax=Fulvitalea axinellae TaxID=1182444 RepID=A0AAU9CSP2_9BACT|nr:hypothetical protein FUAX_18910 [Fulvitalea axinellae]